MADTKRMRLSEEDIKIVLDIRRLNNNPYKIVNSESTYRLCLNREEEDAVAKGRVERAFDNGKIAGKIANNALQYIFKDYDLTITLKNKITGSNSYITIFN